ncbi:MAG: histidine kinase [Candidatus Sulfotelmatobacter sp.]
MKANGSSNMERTKSARTGIHVVGRRDRTQFPLSGVDDGMPGVYRSTIGEAALENLGVGIVVSNSQGTITLVNAAAKQLSQMDPEGKALSAAPSIWGEMSNIKGRRVPVAEWPCMKALRGKTTVSTACHLVRRDGSSCDVLFGACPIRGAESQIVGSLSSLTDITDHKQKEFVLREEAVLSERNRIAADIHDTVVQGLYAIVLQLEAAEEEIIGSPGQARQRLRRVREIARESLADARRSIWTLCQESLYNEDPATALAFLAQKLFQGKPVKLQLSLAKDTRVLPAQMRIELLRIGKEALSNILKHARATTVTVELACLERELRLSVVDDGRGFVSESLPGSQGGFGLFGMRKRAERLGGKLVVESRPERGTQVVAHLPLPIHLARQCA